MSPEQVRVLVVEDEASQRAVLKYNLEAQGYLVELAENGTSGLAAVETFGPDLVVLDWMLPGLSGIDLCHRLKSGATTRNIPVIMLSAKGEEDDRVEGLETGADDYVTKPYSVAELMARIRTQLRRARPSGGAEKLMVGDLVLDSASHKVTRGGRGVKLGPKEFRLLATLMEQPGRVMSRQDLLDTVWGKNIHVDERTVDVHIGRLRKVLTDGGESDPIRTVRGAGYALE